MNFKTRHILAALALHLTVFAALFASAFFHKKVVVPQVIEASLITDPRPPQPELAKKPEPPKEIEKELPPPEPVKPKPKPKPPEKTPEEKKKVEEQRVLEEEKRKLRVQEEQKKREELQLKAEAERQRIEEEKKKQAEQARLKKETEEMQKKALAEEQQRILDEEKREIEEAKRLRAEQDRLRRQAVLDALQAEENQARQGRQAAWGALLVQRIKPFWTRPPGSPNDFKCQLEMQLQPTGEVLGARVVRTCGSEILDRSVEQAVLRARVMPLPPDPKDFVPVITINFCPGACSR